MKLISRLLTLSLIFHFVCHPQYGVAETIKPQEKKKTTFALVKLLTKEMKEQPQKFFSPEELSYKASLMENATTNDAVKEIRKKLSDESFSIVAVKTEIQKQLILEEQSKLIELKYILSKISSEKLDQFFSESMKEGMYDSSYQFSYKSAYNQREKLEVLMQMLQGDLSLIRSQNAKQIGLMDRKALLEQLDATGTFFNYKNDKFLTVLIIVLTVAAAGLITWGVISATKARHERKKKELNTKYDQLEQQAIKDNADKIKSLEEMFAERERLREEGYVWQVCSTTRTQKTASCSYDFKSYSGEEVCVTNCLKQPQTGKETMHTKSCLSSFIPNNCFTKNPTRAGYDDGYDVGYDSGYDSGYNYGYDEAYSSAYNSAYSKAYTEGYDHGYDSGFNAGYSSGQSDYSGEEKNKLTVKSLLKLVQQDDEYGQGYNKGYREGYSYALQLKLGLD